MVILFRVLRDDAINKTMLIPMDSRKLIPKDNQCYFIKNVVDQIDCSEANREFADSPGEFVYPRELLLKLVLMSVLMEDYLLGILSEKLRQTLVICIWQACNILVIVQF